MAQIVEKINFREEGINCPKRQRETFYYES